VLAIHAGTLKIIFMTEFRLRNINTVARQFDKNLIVFTVQTGRKQKELELRHERDEKVH
jgi:hypothetical protein